MIVSRPKKESPFVEKKSVLPEEAGRNGEYNGIHSPHLAEVLPLVYSITISPVERHLILWCHSQFFYRALNHHRNHLAERSPRLSHVTLWIEEFFFIYNTSIFSCTGLSRHNSIQCLSYTEWITLNYCASFIYNSLLK